MSEYTNFENVVERIDNNCEAAFEGLSDFKIGVISTEIKALKNHLEHQLSMAIIESQSHAVLEAVKLIAQKMGVNLDVDRLTLLVKGD